MIEFFKDWVVNIVVVVILLVLLEIFLPSGKIKKVINIVSGTILIITLINPFIKLFNKGYVLKDYFLTETNFINERDIVNSSKHLKDGQTNQIVALYKDKIARRIEGMIKDSKCISKVKVDVGIVEDMGRDNFGEIKNISIELKNNQDNCLPDSIQDKVCNVFNLSKENVAISINKEE